MSQEKWPVSLVQLMRAYPTEAAAEQWFVKARWPRKITCPSCDSDSVNAKVSHPTMPYRCRACRRHFSVKTGTVMQSSNLSYMKWLLALYLLVSNPKGISALQLSKHLEVDYKTAWHLSHRIREAWKDRADPFDGTTEIDETGVGARTRNLPLSKRRAYHFDGVKYVKAIVIGSHQQAARRHEVPQPKSGAHDPLAL